MNKPVAPAGAAKSNRNPRTLLRAALLAALYLCAFTILDFFSQQFEVLRGVVTWYPPAGLTYAMLLVFGVRFAPAVIIALFISSMFIYRMPQPPYLLFLWAFIISLIYAAAAAFLRRLIRFDWQLRKLRDVTWLIVAAVFVSALLAVLSVSSSALSSEMPRSEVLRAIFRWWIGETVGVLTVTPFLLIYVMPALKRFAEGQRVSLPARRSFTRPTLSAIGQTFSIALTLYWVFGARVLDEFRPMYLISLPLIWIALQRGFRGVSAAILALNSGVVLALWLFRFDLTLLGGLELLMIVNCIVGLLMGAVVTERKLAEEALQNQKEELEASNEELMAAEEELRANFDELNAKQRELFESDEKFRETADLLPQTVFEIDLKGNFTYTNRYGFEQTGYTKEDIENGINALSLFIPEDRQRIMTNMGRILGGESLGPNEYTALKKDGSTFPVLVYNKPIVKEAKTVGFRGLVVDITERKRAEEELNHQLKELQRWHAVTIDREERILELKKEVNDLLKESGRPAKYGG